MFSRWSVVFFRSIRMIDRCNSLDYIAGGTLKNIIHDLAIPLTWLERLRYAKDIAAGMVRPRKKQIVDISRSSLHRNIFIHAISFIEI